MISLISLSLISLKTPMIKAGQIKVIRDSINLGDI